MPITIGTKLGSYEISALLGKGGMGEVYRAKDSKLKREVAIKNLPEEFSFDSDRVARFQREAEVLASLNHPNIAAIYDLAEAGGSRYLVLELVEGETLAERIARGPIPFEEALDIAKSICNALEAAHEKGVVHRDLKPANVKITPDGKVKVLDFGLAKALQNRPANAGLSHSPTMVSKSMPGVILGTAAYMSPEQARGREVDRRTDIFAFGAVLYEMLTGQQAFGGEDVAEILGRVVIAQPDWTLLPANVRPRIRELLRLCLQKDVKERRQTATDVRIDINQSSVEPEAVSTNIAASQKRSIVPWIVAALFGIVAGAISLLHFRELPAPEANAVNLSVKLPPDSAPGFLALSPDGRRLVVSGIGPGLSMRSLDSPEFKPLPETNGARVPFWSPDSRFVGFFAQGKLKTIPITGGPATDLCDQVGLGLGGAWNRAGVILFSSGVLAAGPYGEGFLRKVNASGGACTEVTPGAQGTNDDNTGSIPEFLPDGNHFLYSSSGAIYMASLDGMQRRKLLNEHSNAVYAPPLSGKGPGHILFLRDATLMAQPFDPGKLITAGEPFAVVSGLALSLTRPQMTAALAPNGMLAWVAHVNRMRQLKWFDRAGNELGKLGQPGDFSGIAIAPDGKTAVIAATGQVTGGMWLFDFVRNSQTRLTAGETGAAAPVWSPGADRFVYPSHRTLVLRDLNAPDGQGTGVNGEEKDTPLLPVNPNGRAPSDWSRDGHFLIYSQDDPKTGTDIWYLPDPGKPGGKPVKFLSSIAVQSQGQLSPDGHWLAYYSAEPGNVGISIRPFPSGAGVWKVAASVAEPRWNRDGSELFYRQNDGRAETIFAVAIQFDRGGQIRVGEPHKLFSFTAGITFPQINAFGYAPHPDGKRFLVAVDADSEKPELNVVLNWQKLVPTQSK
jgi:serine/threonine protein kinase